VTKRSDPPRPRRADMADDGYDRDAEAYEARSPKPRVLRPGGRVGAITWAWERGRVPAPCGIRSSQMPGYRLPRPASPRRRRAGPARRGGCLAAVGRAAPRTHLARAAPPPMGPVIILGTSQRSGRKRVRLSRVDTAARSGVLPAEDQPEQRLRVPAVITRHHRVSRRLTPRLPPMPRGLP